MPAFRDENILIIAPGSQTTLAQLGLPESFTPASHRFPTRVFPAPDGKTWEPFKIRSLRKEKEVVNGNVEEGAMEGVEKTEEGEGEEEEQLIEFPEDEEGAVWPLKGIFLGTVSVGSVAIEEVNLANEWNLSRGTN